MELALARLHAGPQHDRGADFLSHTLVEKGERDRLHHGGVGEQHLVHLSGRDLLPRAVDDLLEAPAQEEKSVIVQAALVPSAEPAVREGELVRLCVPCVAGEDALSANRHLADLARRKPAARLVEDRHSGARGLSDRTRLRSSGGSRLLVIWCAASVMP